LEGARRNRGRVHFRGAMASGGGQNKKEVKCTTVLGSVRLILVVEKPEKVTHSHARGGLKRKNRGGGGKAEKKNNGAGDHPWSMGNGKKKKRPEAT